MSQFAEVLVVREDGTELVRYKKLPTYTAEVVAEDIYGTEVFRQVKVRDLKTKEYIRIFPGPSAIGYDGTL